MDGSNGDRTRPAIGENAMSSSIAYEDFASFNAEVDINDSAELVQQAKPGSSTSTMSATEACSPSSPSTPTAAILKQKLIDANRKTAQVLQEKMTLQRHVAELKAKMEKKEILLKRLVEENSKNVQKLKATEKRLEEKQEELAIVSKDMNQSQAKHDATVTQLTKTVEILRNRLSQSPPEPSKGNGAKEAAFGVIKEEDDVEVIRPADPTWCANGVFVFRRGMDMNICLKLPIRVTMKETKMTILDADLASANQVMKLKRQDAALQAIKLLINPRTETLTLQRRQILTLVLMNKMLNEFGFKDPRDTFKVGPDDRVLLKSSQIIKTYRPDLAEDARAVRRLMVENPNQRTERETREMEVVRFLKSLDDLPPEQHPSPFRKKTASAKSKPSESAAPVVEGEPERCIDHERRLFTAANWNAKHASALFQTLILNPQNVMMNVFYLPDYSAHNTIAFVPAMRVGTGDVCQIPFLIDLPLGQTAVKPVASAAIAGFEFGVTVSNPHDVDTTSCYLCSAVYPQSYMETHLRVGHSLEVDPSLGPPVPGEETRQAKGPFDDVQLWSVNVDQQKLESFGSPRNLVLNIVPVRGADAPKLSPAELPTIKQEPDPGNRRPVPRKRYLNFGCRYCPRRFTTTRGWDAHLDSRHGDKVPFACPFEGCADCYATKTGLMQHMEFACKFYKADGPVRTNAELETSNEDLNASEVNPPPRRVSLLKTETKGQGNKIVDAAAEPTGNEKEDVGKKLPRGRPRKRKGSMLSAKPPKITDGDLNKSDEIEDIKPSASECSEQSFDSKSTDGNIEKAAVKRSASGSRALRSKAAASEPTPTTPAQQRQKPPGASTPLQPALALEKSPSQSMTKRLKRHPQVAFTAILKDIIIGCAGFIKDRSKSVRKEGVLKNKLKSLHLRPIEDKVDRDHYNTREQFLTEFKSFCTDFVVSEHSEDRSVYERLREEMVKNSEEEVLLRDAELAALEKEINPMLSDDLNVAFRHCQLKILDEVRMLRVSHAFASRVNKSQLPDYYDVVKEPICLDDIATAAQYGEYKNRTEFARAFTKMYDNSVAYNGKQDQLSKDALVILNLVKNSLKKYQKFVIE